MAEEALKKLERLTDELDAAQKASKQVLRELQRAKRTTAKTERAVKLRQHPDYTTLTRKRSKHR